MNRPLVGVQMIVFGQTVLEEEMCIRDRDYNPFLGFDASPWVGFAHFQDFFSSEYFGRLLKNTVVISLVNLAFNFPMPIIIALMINEISNSHIKKTAQTIIYLPHFISSVVIAGMVLSLLPVSYTHLDVYKRQVFLPAGRGAICCHSKT